MTISRCSVQPSQGGHRESDDLLPWPAWPSPWPWACPVPLTKPLCNLCDNAICNCLSCGISMVITEWPLTGHVGKTGANGTEKAWNCLRGHGHGVGLLSQFPSFRYFLSWLKLSKHCLPIKHHVHIWQMWPQLSCCDTVEYEYDSNNLERNRSNISVPKWRNWRIKLLAFSLMWK